MSWITKRDERWTRRNTWSVTIKCQKVIRALSGAGKIDEFAQCSKRYKGIVSPLGWMFSNQLLHPFTWPSPMDLKGLFLRIDEMTSHSDICFLGGQLFIYIYTHTHTHTHTHTPTHIHIYIVHQKYLSSAPYVPNTFPMTGVTLWIKQSYTLLQLTF